MFTSIKNTKKGFTLIELLVVIAIIGILSSVVLASLSTARQKSRDAKRISDVGQIQLALELFFDASQSYPSTTPGAFTGQDAAVKQLASVTYGFLPKAPVPPPGAGLTYYYHGITIAGGVVDCDGVGANSCLSYVVGAGLERSDNTVLSTDADVTTSGGTNAFIGTNQTCLFGGAATPEQCYDLKP